jgi:hypothetical protein
VFPNSSMQSSILLSVTVAVAVAVAVVQRKMGMAPPIRTIRPSFGCCCYCCSVFIIDSRSAALQQSRHKFRSVQRHERTRKFRNGAFRGWSNHNVCRGHTEALYASPRVECMHACSLTSLRTSSYINMMFELLFAITKHTLCNLWS